MKERKNSNWGGRRPGAGRKPAPTELVVLYTRVLKETKKKITDMATEQGCRVGKIIDELV